MSGATTLLGPLQAQPQTTLDRLLGNLSRVYDTSAGPVLGLRLSYLNGGMQWTIAADTLTTVVSGGIGQPLSVDLTQYTIAALATYLAGQPGYAVLYLDNTGLADLSALALVPGTNDIALSNGDHIYIAANLNWLYLASIAAELLLAQEAIEAMPAEMATTSADGEWLDLLGSYYAVPRLLGEQDTQYSPRIPAEVILPRQNNVAIAAAIEVSTGQNATCTNAPVYGNPEPAYDGTINFSGAPHFYNASAQIIYNLFNVSIGYAILGGLSPTDYLAAIRQQIDRLRAAGTHLLNLTLTASVMGDTFTPPTDSWSETITKSGLTGVGFSSDSGVCAGFYPVILTPLSFSADHAIAALTTGIRLIGTSSSYDAVAFAIPPATGSSSDSSSAVLTAGAGAVLVGTSTSVSLAFGAIGTAFFLNGSGSSVDTAGASPQGSGFSSGFSSGFRGLIPGYGVYLRTGAGFVAASSSIDTGSPVLSTAIRLTGTGTSTDVGRFTPGYFSLAPALSANSAIGVLTTSIPLNSFTFGLNANSAAGIITTYHALQGSGASVDGDGGTGEVLTTSGPIIPGPVTGVTATPGTGDTLVINWNLAVNALDYIVYTSFTGAAGSFTEATFTTGATTATLTYNLPEP